MMTNYIDFNELTLPTDTDPEPQKDHSIVDGDMAAYFRHLKPKLVKHIDTADVVVGSVAWLTDGEILDALAKKNAVSIIVQKEDFLRRDMGKVSKPELRKQYDKLKSGRRYEMNVGHLSFCVDPTLDPIRCVGNHNKANTSYPRAHNKFVVFVSNGRANPSPWRR
jgi:hypothetical protein